MRYPDLYDCVNADDYHERIIFGALVEEHLDRLREALEQARAALERWKRDGDERYVMDALALLEPLRHDVLGAQSDTDAHPRADFGEET